MNKMEKSSLTVFEYTKGDETIRLEKSSNVLTSQIGNSVSDMQSPKFNIVEAEFETTTKGKVVKSPIVGTYYEANSPESAPFIKVGMEVKKGDILCIVEAMKMMNEIECEFEGTVLEILVSNGQVVEFGQPLFVIS